MKCGICHKETGIDGEPYYDGGRLSQHKRKEHPDVLQASRVKQRDNATNKRLREVAIAASVRAAAAQATGVVLYKRNDRTPDHIENLEGYSTAVKYGGYRVAEPGLYLQHQAFVLQAAAMLEQAYQQGTPVTEADVERVRLAVAEARQKAETEVA